MSITITGPMSYVCAETLGRQRSYQWADLDRLQVAYIGPAGSLEKFSINSPHPDYPLMFVLNTQEETFEGGLTRLQVTYEGKFTTKGQSTYITAAVISESPAEGSRDFTQPYMTPVGTPGLVLVPQPGTPVLAAQIAQLYNVGTQQVTYRYIGTQVSLRYQAYPRPTHLNYNDLGTSLVQMEVISITKGTVSIVMQGTTQGIANAWFATNIPQSPVLYARNMGMSIEQRGRWYNVTEVYGMTF